MSGRNAAQRLGVLGHQLAGPFGVAAAPLHDLHEAGATGSPTMSRSMSLLSLKVGSPSNSFDGMRPPLVLLGPIAVGPRRLLRLEAHQRDGPAVVGDPAGRTEPAGGAGRDLLEPIVDRGAQGGRILHASLDHLNEHDCLLEWAVGLPGRFEASAADRHRRGSESNRSEARRAEQPGVSGVHQGLALPTIAATGGSSAARASAATRNGVGAGTRKPKATSKRQGIMIAK